MSTIVIVARTRMQNDHVCIGGHNLDHDFRGVRLLDWIGDHWTNDSPFQVGELWAVRYTEKIGTHRPHVEDVCVQSQSRIGEAEDLAALVLGHVQPWTGPPNALFDGTVRSTPAGGAYIPSSGPLPSCSTGYWVPADDLVRHISGTKARFLAGAKGSIRGFPWVGVQAPPARIGAGSLVRVSLSHLFKSETAPKGYYVQISGVL